LVQSVGFPRPLFAIDAGRSSLSLLSSLSRCCIANFTSSRVIASQARNCSSKLSSPAKALPQTREISTFLRDERTSRLRSFPLSTSLGFARHIVKTVRVSCNDQALDYPLNLQSRQFQLPSFHYILQVLPFSHNHLIRLRSTPTHPRIILRTLLRSLRLMSSPSLPSTPPSKPTRPNAAFPHLLSTEQPGLEDVARLFKEGKAKNVIVMVSLLSPRFAKTLLLLLPSQFLLSFASCPDS